MVVKLVSMQLVAKLVSIYFITKLVSKLEAKLVSNISYIKVLATYDY